MNGTWSTAGSVMAFVWVGPLVAGDLPVVPGFTVEVYAELCNPVGIAFEPKGFLFAANGGCGAGKTAPAWVRRISPGGEVVENYGESQIVDPDLVLVDTRGFIAEPGSVLVGSNPNVEAILPDQSITTAVDVVANVYDLVFDCQGRLLLTDQNNNSDVFVSTGGTAELLFSVPSDFVTLAIDDENRIYTFTVDGTLRIYGSDGSVIDDAFVTGLGSGNGGRMVFGPGGAFGSELYLTQHDSELLYRIDPSGNVDIVGSGMGVSHLAFGPDGALYLSQQLEDRILRIAPDCPADLNGDGSVGVPDLLILLGFWGRCGPVCLGDLDGDDDVGVKDLLILLGNWGPCP